MIEGYFGENGQLFFEIELVTNDGLNLAVDALFDSGFAGFMAKVIIDTNVLVSAVLKGREPRDVIQFVVDSPNCDWVVSEEILAEYQDVLSRKKFKLTDEVRKEWLLEDRFFVSW